MSNDIIHQKEIENRIYSIRGQYVMLDTHFAEFYGVKPIRLREQVKRNLLRFPPDFMFQLNDEEVDYMVSQNAIPSKQHLGGYLPVEVKLLKNAHDRFLVIDEKELYHIGASLKDLGKKWFAFSKMNTETLSLLSNLKNKEVFNHGE